jgi:hypothetical protein
MNLAFPQAAGPGWSASPWNVALLALVLAAIAALTGAAYVASRRSEASDAGDRRQPASQPRARWTTAAVAAGIVLLSGAATAFNGEWTRNAYLQRETDAWAAAAAALGDRDRCGFCFATRSAALDWRWLEPNTTTGVEVDTQQSGLATSVQIALTGSQDSGRFGRIRIDFGDGAATSWMGIVGERRLVHRYRQPGSYPLVVWLQLRNGELRADRRTVVVTGS